MYPQAEKELARLLTSQTYPALIGQPDYQALLKNGKPDPMLCQKKAAEVVQRLRSSGGVHEFGSKQAVEAKVWKAVLFRGVDKARQNGAGPWWVDEEIVKRWERNYAGEPPAQRRAQVLKAMRAMLAVCYDWSNVDELWMMRAPNGGIPVLTGQGTHQPVNHAEAQQLTAAGRSNEVKVFFIGGYQQVYVPFVPKSLIAPYPV